MADFTKRLMQEVDDSADGKLSFPEFRHLFIKHKRGELLAERQLIQNQNNEQPQLHQQQNQKQQQRDKEEEDEAEYSRKMQQLKQQQTQELQAARRKLHDEWDEVGMEEWEFIIKGEVYTSQHKHTRSYIHTCVYVMYGWASGGFRNMMSQLPFGHILYGINDFLYIPCSHTQHITHFISSYLDIAINDGLVQPSAFGNLVLGLFVAGASCGIATLVTNPVDVIKTRMQIVKVNYNLLDMAIAVLTPSYSNVVLGFF